MKFQELSRENKPPLYLGEDNRWEQAGFPIALFLLVKFHQKSTHFFFAPIPKSPLFFGFFSWGRIVFLPLVFAENGKNPILSTCFALFGICLTMMTWRLWAVFLPHILNPSFPPQILVFVSISRFKKLVSDYQCIVWLLREQVYWESRSRMRL